MFVKKSLKLTGMALAIMLATGCQQAGSSQSSGAEDPPANAQEQQAKPADAAAAAIVTVHLAQQASEPSLVAVELGEDQTLHALPQPILTQADMEQVTPVTAEDGSTYILFDLTPKGKETLANVSQQARGHYFLISVRGQLIHVAQIDEPLTDGQLVIATSNEQQNRRIIELLR